MMIALDGFLPETPAYLLAGGGKFNPLEVENPLSLVFWTLVAFLVLFYLLTRFAWRPLMEAVRRREQQIASDIQSAEESRQIALVTMQKHKLELEQASREAKALLDEARVRAGTLQAELESEARAESQLLLERARKSIEAEKQQALREIKDQVVDLSVAITSKLVEKSIDREDHLREAEALLARLSESI